MIGNNVCNSITTNNAQCSFDFGDCCPFPDLIGNSICNDITNNPECHYDGGDCCLFDLISNQCSECACSINGVITSPGFPRYGYGEHLDLTWHIQVSPGQQIEINFIVFELYMSEKVA